MQIKYRRDLGSIAPPRGDAAEIGVAEGYFSAEILSWAIAFPRVYMVDRWSSCPTQKGDASNAQSWHDRNLAAAKARVAPYGERAVFLQGDSVEMAKRVPNHSLSLLYIDGDHSYEGVIADLRAWYRKVRRGGIIAFHDYEAPEYGVKQAVQDWCRGRQRIYLIPEDKLEDAGAFILC